MAKKASTKPEPSPPATRSKVSQADFPNYPLSDVIRIPRALHDHLAGGPAAPHDVALAISLSPTSSQWRMLAGCALAYGLTTASYSADRIGISELGRRVVAPTIEGDDAVALKEALLKPRVLKEFFKKYDRNKFPREDIAKNILAEMGVPRDRLDAAFALLLKNGKDYGLIRETKTGPFVALEAAVQALPPITTSTDPSGAFEENNSNVVALPTVTQTSAPLNNRVFISHGKNRRILDQLKTVIGYGNFEPIVSIENETISKPLSDKVMDDMRSCSFAVIHVEDEMSLLDAQGDRHLYLNQNVLIEIGAALALHRSRFVLLVKEGVQLPSNLQGLYQCRYSGDTLDFDATMRLLKAFNEFRGK